MAVATCPWVSLAMEANYRIYCTSVLFSWMALISAVTDGPIEAYFLIRIRQFSYPWRFLWDRHILKIRVSVRVGFNRRIITISHWLWFLWRRLTPHRISYLTTSSSLYLIQWALPTDCVIAHTDGKHVYESSHLFDVMDLFTMHYKLQGVFRLRRSGRAAYIRESHSKCYK